MDIFRHCALQRTQNFSLRNKNGKIGGGGRLSPDFRSCQRKILLLGNKDNYAKK